MSQRLLSPSPSPSASNLSFQSFKSNEEYLFGSRDDPHNQAEKTIDDWADCLKSIVKSDAHEEFQKTCKLFVQADAHAKNTHQALDKTSKAMHALLSKQEFIRDTMTDLEKMQHALDMDQVARNS
ncbi:hypothetical protein BCR43DRAFT_490874 [Syncephalastrum racemosum]|uniref:BLOC-1-related complex subunit 7 n=1 Tax=Syncephalastrum racemosum TaxID=13706 RepID=A0A1X2HGP7_SYNRA|nr:hypothetical protein BCR43DRAFT_490874 [Syncephalastrum racemosum]